MVVQELTGDNSKVVFIEFSIIISKFDILYYIATHLRALRKLNGKRQVAWAEFLKLFGLFCNGCEADPHLHLKTRPRFHSER